MSNYRVTPPLMSGETYTSASEDRSQPTFSTPVVESSVEMEPIQKKEQVAEQAVKTSAAAQSGASKKKTQKAPNAFRTISEVANELEVQQHVLRFWETKFTQVKPLKRGGGRRYYRPEDVALLKRIHHLLYTEGYTIKGVQKLLKGRSKSQVAGSQAENQNAAAAPAPQPKVQPATQAAVQASGMSAKQRAVLEMMLAELKALRSMVKA